MKRIKGCSTNETIRSVVNGWDQKKKEQNRDLLCGLLIKCADICNVVSITCVFFRGRISGSSRLDRMQQVFYFIYFARWIICLYLLQARRYDIAVQWAAILTDEFSNQGDMEKALDIPTCLFGGPPDPDNLVKLGESQIGFISIFALPLFSCMSEILPSMGFTVGELTANIEIWRKRVKGWMEPGGTIGTKGCLVTSDPSQCPISAAMRQARQASASASSSSKSSVSSMPLTKSRQRTKMTSATAKGQKDIDTDTDSDNYTEAESQMKDDENEDDEREDYENEDEEYVSPRSSFGELSPVFPQEAGPASASASASVSPSVSSSTSSTTTTTQKTSRQSSGGALRRAVAAGGTGASMGAPTNDRENGFAFGLPGVSTIPTIAVGAVTAGKLTEASAATPPISSDGCSSCYSPHEVWAAGIRERC